MKTVYQLINYFLAAVWLINGLYCKLLDLVPRHEEIVARILSEEHSRILTAVIGIAEIIMAIWIISEIKIKLNVILQMIVIAVMNIIEFILAPDLLLWGHYNSLFAFLFIVLIYTNKFLIPQKNMII
ncbi:DoxX-like family protein [Chryseobacterium aquaticum]|uniref:DoxX-like family protein n=1 Tax=Chryseobacterium aquaticum TaxID=452084 RepID=UPI002FC592DE